MHAGTIHRLHVSEFGKICAKFPDKAHEVVTGSLPAVPLDGIAIIESTAEGQDGEFYKMTQRAIGLADAKAKLSPRDYRFHFFPWRSEEHTSELQSLMRISYAVFCLKNKTLPSNKHTVQHNTIRI